MSLNGGIIVCKECGQALPDPLAPHTFVDCESFKRFKEIRRRNIGDFGHSIDVTMDLKTDWLKKFELLSERVKRISNESDPEGLYPWR